MIEQQFTEYVVKQLVDKPEAVKVERTEDEKGVLLKLSVDPGDLGRVIGRRGATAQSLRTLLRALGMKNEARYNLRIVDTDSEPNAASVKSTTPSTSTTDNAVDNYEHTSDSQISDRVKKLREGLAEDDDLDI